MPIKTDLNVSPYFDDFDANNQYYRVLFRPSVAVQARELTQVQSILQNQIESFGNWAFRNGDIVSGCSITDDPLLDYIRLADKQTNGSLYDATLFANAQVVSESSNLTAIILTSNNGLGYAYPNTKIAYIKYINTGDNGEKVFHSNSTSNNVPETLTFYKIPRTGNALVDTIATVQTFTNSVSQNSTGRAHGIHVDAGVVYLNGTFVQVLNPTYGIVNNNGTYAGNNVVGFQLIESKVSDAQDETLLDNALGYPNENAPGAHRLKLIPTLISIDPDQVAVANGFNPIVAYNYGAMIKKASPGANVYSVIGDALAKRTYEESGNYVVNPFVVDAISRASSIVSNLNPDHFLGRINAGSGYAQGYKVGYDATKYVEMRRGIDTATNEDRDITFNYGSYFVLKEVAGSFAFDKAQSVDLYDGYIQAVTTRAFINLTPSTTGANTIINNGHKANKIGTALLKCFTFNSGIPGSNTATYLLHVFNVKITDTTKSPSDVKSIFYNGTRKGVGDLAIAGIQQTTSKDQLFSLGIEDGVAGLKNLKDASSVRNTNYIYRTRVSDTLSTTGDVTITLSGNNYIPYGIGILPDIDASSYTLVAAANVDTAALLGTVGCSSTSTTVTGSVSPVATTFKSSFNIGDQIKIGSDVRTITAISTDTSLTVDAVWSATLSTQAYKKAYVAGKIIPITTTSGGPSSFVQVTNTTSFTINTSEAPSTSLAIDIVFDVKVTDASPVSKAIKKNRFVKINTTTNPSGPWCLGVGDIHRIRNIYGSNSTYSRSNSDVTKYFTFDSGQKDTHYDLGYIYPVPGYKPSQTDTSLLLVEMDYFFANTSQQGFFTVESYPISDGLPGIVNAVSTSIIGTNDTTFSTSFVVSDRIQIGEEVRTISTISNSTVMTVNSPFNNDYYGAPYFKYDTVQTKDIPLYIDETGNKRPLRNYVDFRTPCIQTAVDTGSCDVSNSTQVTASLALASVNPSNTLTLKVPTSPDVGLNIPSYGRNFNTDYTYYLPRKDLVIFTPDNTIKVKEGLASLSPQTPISPDNGMVVAVINVPAYPSLTTDQRDELLPINQSSTKLIRDTSTSITTNVVTSRRYTMRDIGILDNRISDLEYYTSLSLLEKKASDMTVTDANGLNRFKNGIFVETFNDYTKSEVSNPEYSFAIDSAQTRGRPRIIREAIEIQFDLLNSTDVQKTDCIITLPYEEIPHLIQPWSTKYIGAAHVSVAWNGNVKLFPSYDNQSDPKNTGSLDITVNLATPWTEFAKTPGGSIYGDWRIVNQQSTGVDTKIVGQTAAVVDIGKFGLFYSAAGAQAGALKIIQSMYGTNVTIGKYNLTYSDIRLKKNILRIGKLLNGLNLYRYRYLWSDVFYVGVMAQEVEQIIPEAVVYGSDGYMMVNYDKISVPFLTWDKWLNSNSVMA
jgi:hypothetical protein